MTTVFRFRCVSKKMSGDLNCVEHSSFRVMQMMLVYCVVNTVRKSTDGLLVTGKETNLQVDAEKLCVCCWLVKRMQVTTTGQEQTVKPLENKAYFRCLRIAFHLRIN
jgi:predicted TIM-barrel enzyme